MKNLISTNDDLRLDVGSALSSGDPVLIGKLPAVCVTDADASNIATVKTKGVFALPYTVAGAVAVGAPLYLNTGVMDDADDAVTGVIFGYAAEAIGGAGSGTVNVIVK